MSEPAISVVFPVYRSHWVEQSVQSILDQTFEDFELILIDDSDQEEMHRRLQNIAQTDRRIRLISNANNLGIVASLNIGMDLAKGRYIARMDDDDIARPHRFASQIQFLEQNPEIFLLGGSYTYINANDETIGSQTRAYAPKAVVKYLLKSGVIHHPTVMFRNQHDYRYREKALWCEDRDLWLRMITDGRQLQVLSDIVLDYRIHEKSISARKYLQQAAFVNQALAWHQERIDTGQDSYDSFDVSEILSMDTHSEQYVSILEMKIQYKSGQGRPKLRQKIRAFWKTHGFTAWKPAWLIYPMTFLPRPIEQVLLKQILRYYE